MEMPIRRVIEHQRQALEFVLDALGLRQAYDEVSQLPETRKCERAAAALETEFEALGAPASQRAPDDI